MKETLKSILSVDLAVRSYQDCGFVVLRKKQEGFTAYFPTATELGLHGRPEPEPMAEALAVFCWSQRVGLLIIDGPQGWKNPKSPLAFRCADFEAKAPAKVCEVGIVKPRTYLRFVDFSTKLFFLLAHMHRMKLAYKFKGKLANFPHGKTLLCESLPFVSWCALGIKPLPAKAKCTKVEIKKRYDYLCEQFHLKSLKSEPTHDELQALVASITGIHLLAEEPHNVRIYGRNPILSKDCILEGLILAPPSSSRIPSLGKNY